MISADQDQYMAAQNIIRIKTGQRPATRCCNGVRIPKLQVESVR